MYWFQQGCVLISLGFEEKALSAIYLALDQSKNTHNDLKEVRDRIASAIASGPSGKSFTEIGIAFERIGQENIARQAYIMAKEYDPTYLEPLLRLCDIARYKEEARHYVLQAREIRPNDPEVLVRQADVFYDYGKPQEAYELFLQAVALCGSHEYAELRIADIETEIIESGGLLEPAGHYDELADWFG
jgi:tetratricopeptide (TPR) repeat protein